MGDTGIPRYILEVAQSFFTRLRGGINANDNVDHLRWLFKTIVGMPKASSAFVEVCDEYGEWCDLPWGHGSAVEFVTRENLGPPYDSRFLTVGRLATYIKARRSVTRRRQASILEKMLAGLKTVITSNPLVYEGAMAIYAFDACCRNGCFDCTDKSCIETDKVKFALRDAAEISACGLGLSPDTLTEVLTTVDLTCGSDSEANRMGRLWTAFKQLPLRGTFDRQQSLVPTKSKISPHASSIAESTHEAVEEELDDWHYREDQEIWGIIGNAEADMNDDSDDEDRVPFSEQMPQDDEVRAMIHRMKTMPTEAPFRRHRITVDPERMALSLGMDATAAGIANEKATMGRHSEGNALLQFKASLNARARNRLRVFNGGGFIIFTVGRLIFMFSKTTYDDFVKDIRRQYLSAIYAYHHRYPEIPTGGHFWGAYVKMRIEVGKKICQYVKERDVASLGRIASAIYKETALYMNDFGESQYMSVLRDRFGQGCSIDLGTAGRSGSLADDIIKLGSIHHVGSECYRRFGPLEVQSDSSSS